MASCRELTNDELDLVSGGRYISGWGWDVTGSSSSGFDWGWVADALGNLSSGFNNAAGVGAGVSGVAIVSAVAQGGADLPNDAFAVAATAATGVGYGLGAAFNYASEGARWMAGEAIP